MKIKIENVIAKSYKSFECLTLGPKHFEPGLYLVEGVNEDDATDGQRSNGAGKSTLAMDVLSWGLFGKTVRPLKSTDDVCSWNIEAEGEDCRVSVWFSCADRMYAVHRTRGSRSELGFILCMPDEPELTQENLTRKTMAHTQEDIESVLGLDWRAFCSSFVFGASSAFKFSSLKDTERKLVIESALGVEIYRQAAKKGRERAKDLVAEIRQIEAHVAERKAYLKEAEQRVAAYEKAEKEELQRRSKALGDIEILKKRLDAIPDDYLRRQQWVDDQQRWAKRREVKLATRQRLDRRLTLVEQEVRRFRKLVDSELCPTCGQRVPTSDPELIAQAKEQIEQQTAREKRLVNKLALADARLTELRVALDDVHDKLEKSDRKQRSREQIENEIRVAEEHASNRASLINFDAMIGTEKFKIGKAKAELEQSTERLHVVRSDYETYAYLVEAFGDQGVATAVVEHAMPVMNKAADEVAFGMGGGERVSFVASREKGDKVVNEVHLVVEKDEVEVPYENLSGGEAASIDFASGIAVQALVAGSSDFNVAVFDEVLDHLDRVGASRVIRFLEHLAKTKAVWLISHAEWLGDVAHYKQVLTVVRKDGVSKLVAA